MREMHKWKDKVELSLDNRQIFFLFFGMSVVGCFVFGLGVMVGRSTDAPVPTSGGGDVASLEALDAGSPGHAPFDFEQDLARSSLDEIPQTRDPAIAPRSAEALAAIRSDAEVDDAPVAETPGAVIAKADAAQLPGSKPAGKPAAGKPAPAKPVAAKPEPAKTESATLASGTAGTAGKPAPVAGRRFTLQMKAFADKAEADKLAATLRGNGHEVRVDVGDVKGRTWHRVRMGSFDSWDDAVKAKEDFEKKERVIAYVMSM